MEFGWLGFDIISYNALAKIYTDYTFHTLTLPVEIK